MIYANRIQLDSITNIHYPLHLNLDSGDETHAGFRPHSLLMLIEASAAGLALILKYIVLGEKVSWWGAEESSLRLQYRQYLSSTRFHSLLRLQDL